MFFIVNRTKENIILSDIDVKLGPRQAIDLDKIMSRQKSDASACLRKTLSVGAIEVKVKDDINKNSIRISTSPPPDNENLKKDIIDEIKGLLRVQNSSLTKEDMIEVMKTFIGSINMTTSEAINNKQTSTEIDMDENVLADINARSVNNLLKNVDQKSLKYKEKEEKNTIINDINELEDLLG